MDANSLLLPHLAKSQKGNASQKEGDTRVQVPNTFLPILTLPHPFFFFNSVAQTGQELKSFCQTDQRLFNVTTTQTLCEAGPGLWKFRWAHWIVPEGAVTDLTCNCRLQLVLVDGINPTIDLSRFTNSITPFQSLDGEFEALISSEQAIRFVFNSVLGAGTGTSRSLMRIMGTRLF